MLNLSSSHQPRTPLRDNHPQFSSVDTFSQIVFRDSETGKIISSEQAYKSIHGSRQDQLLRKGASMGLFEYKPRSAISPDPNQVFCSDDQKIASFTEGSIKLEISITENAGQNNLVLRQFDLSGTELSSLTLSGNLAEYEQNKIKLQDFFGQQNKAFLFSDKVFEGKTLKDLYFANLIQNEGGSQAYGNIANIIMYDNQVYFLIFNEDKELCNNIPMNIYNFLNTYEQDGQSSSTAYQKLITSLSRQNSYDTSIESTAKKDYTSIESTIAIDSKTFALSIARNDSTKYFVTILEMPSSTPILPLTPINVLDQTATAVDQETHQDSAQASPSETATADRASQSASATATPLDGASHQDTAQASPSETATADRASQSVTATATPLDGASHQYIAQAIQSASATADRASQSVTATATVDQVTHQDTTQAIQSASASATAVDQVTQPSTTQVVGVVNPKTSSPQDIIYQCPINPIAEQFEIECSDNDIAELASELISDYKSYCSSGSSKKQFDEWLIEDSKIENRLKFEESKDCFVIQKDSDKQKLNDLSLVRCLSDLADECYDYLPQTSKDKIDEIVKTSSSSKPETTAKAIAQLNPDNFNRMSDVNIAMTIIFSFFGALLLGVGVAKLNKKCQQRTNGEGAGNEGGGAYVSSLLVGSNNMDTEVGINNRHQEVRADDPELGHVDERAAVIASASPNIVQLPGSSPSQQGADPLGGRDELENTTFV